MIAAEYIMCAAAVLAAGGLVLNEVKQETAGLSAEFRGTMRQTLKQPQLKSFEKKVESEAVSDVFDYSYAQRTP